MTSRNFLGSVGETGELFAIFGCAASRMVYTSSFLCDVVGMFVLYCLFDLL